MVFVYIFVFLCCCVFVVVKTSNYKYGAFLIDNLRLAFYRFVTVSTFQSLQVRDVVFVHCNL